MKKTKFLILSVFAALSCISLSAAEKEAADVYEPTATPISIPKSYKPRTKRASSNKLTEPVKMLESSVFRYNFLESSVVQEDADIYYNPENKSVEIAFDSKKNHVLSFDENARGLLLAAFQTYENEFDQKKLIVKKNKTVKKYGKIPCDYRIKSALNNTKSKPTVKVGYVFVDNSPYFLISIPESNSVIKNPVDSSRERKNPAAKLLFNRNQMSEFLSQCNEEAISKTIEKALFEKNNAAEGDGEKDQKSAESTLQASPAAE